MEGVIFNMANKRVFKVATASAVAASALVAAVPASAASVTYEQAEKQVNVAREAANGLHAEYTKNADYKTKVDIKEANDELNRAKAKIAALSDAKQKAYLSSRIQGTIDTVARANAYNNAVRVGTEILPAAHQAVVEAADVASLKEGNVLLAAKIKQAKETFPKVYGKEMQTSFATMYLTADLEADRKDGHYAAITADRVAEGLKLIAAGKVEDAEVQYKNAEASFKAVKGLESIKEIIAADWTELGKKIEAAKTPKVESVSAVNPTTVEVKFNQAIDKETVNKSVSINNVAVDGTTLYNLSEDGKTLTVKVPQLEVDKAYAVKVDGLKSASGKEVDTFVEKVLFADSQAATVTGISAKAGTSGKTNTVEIVFSEDVTASAANFRVNNVSPSKIVVDKNVVTLTLTSDIDSTKTNELRVVDVKDLSGNKTNTTQEFAISSDTTAPVVDVKVKDENTLTLTFDEAVKSVDSTNVKVLKGNINVTGIVGPLSADGKSVDVQVNPLVFGTKETSANLTVEVNGVKDLYDNASSKTTKNVTVVKDVAAPTATKVEGTVGTKTFVISFSEELAGKAGDAVTAPSFFKDNMKLNVAGAKLKADKDGKLTQVEVTTEADLVAGNYEVTLSEGTVSDDTISKNKNSQAKLTLTATTATGEADTGKPEVSTASVTGDVLKVTFKEDVTASAVDYRNYKINGSVIPSTSTLYFDNNKKTVVIELPKGSFSSDKNDNILEISDVTDLAGNAMNKYTKLDLAVTDTKAATLVSAKLAGNNQVSLTFNEDIDTKSAFASGKVTIKDAAGNSVLVKAGTNSITTGAKATVTGKVVTITLADGEALDLSKSYTISVESGVNLVDQAGLDNDGVGIEVASFSNVALVDGIAPTLAAGDYFADTTFPTSVIGTTVPAISTKKDAIDKVASLGGEMPANAKLVYADADEKTADVVVTGTVEINVSQDKYTYSFGTANLSSLTAGKLKVSLVLVDANGNESTAYNVVADGTGNAATELTLVK